MLNRKFAMTEPDKLTHVQRDTSPPTPIFHPDLRRAELLRLLTEKRNFWVRLAQAQLGRKNDAEDVVQQMIVGVLSLPQLPKINSLEAWLMGVLRHKIIDVLRDRQRHIFYDPERLEKELEQLTPQGFTADGSWDSVENWSPDPLNASIHQQEMEFLKICLDALPEATKNIFLLREYLEFSFADIEAQCGISQGNLRVVLYRARMRLRQCLSRKMAI